MARQWHEVHFGQPLIQKQMEKGKKRITKLPIFKKVSSKYCCGR